MCAYTVYKHTSPSGKVYIGITGQSVEKRWKSNGLGYQTQSYFWKAIQKYGWKNFKHEVITEGLTKEEAETMEMQLIDQFRSNDPNYGYNIREGGSLSSWREDSREKLRQANLGKHHSEDTKRKLRECNLGKVMSDEVRRKISASTKGKPKTKEHARHISEGQKGRPSKLKKPVMRVEDGVIFPSALEAGKALGLKSTSTVSHACTGIRKTAGGYHWRYVDDDCQE